MKTLGLILKWCLLFVIIFLVSSFAVRVVSNYPQEGYERNNANHPLDKDCRAVKVGDDIRATMEIIRRNGEPTLESLDGDLLVVRRGNISCRVTLDTRTMRVVKAESNTDVYNFDIRQQ